jgi:hypothetical protein
VSWRVKQRGAHDGDWCTERGLEMYVDEVMETPEYQAAEAVRLSALGGRKTPLIKAGTYLGT